MSGLGIAAVVVTSLWLGGLTLVVVLVIRQVALVTIRLDHLPGPVVGSLEDNGPKLGSRVPEVVTHQLPELETDLSHLLLLSATCTPCREIASELARRPLPNSRSIVALVPGREEMADGVVAMLPPSIRAVRDPDATDLATLLEIQIVPSALTVKGGVIAAKAAALGSAADLIRFMNTSSSPAKGAVSPPSREGVGHVG
jgi:hypothetical protein